MLMKKTLILGASNNPDRYAYIAAEKLLRYQHDIVLVGIKKGEVFGREILTEKVIHCDIHTITLYVGPQNQGEWIDYIFNTQPQRIIFNPGTENPWLYKEAHKKGIEPLFACTLVMLSTGQY